MKRFKTFEMYSPNMELNNEVKDHLSQFPYLAYQVKDLNDGVEITFSNDLTNIKYLKGLLDPYKVEIISKNPIKFKVSGKKNVDKYQDYQGKTIIENVETIDFPDLKIEKLKVKVDTGATTTSLGVSFVKIDRQRKKVTFIPLNDKYQQYTGDKITLPLESEIRVQSSNGDEESRPMIKTDIVIRDKTYEAFVTLANRDELEYPVLLGKDILAGNFLINPGI
jgi:hypothetical protein